MSFAVKKVATPVILVLAATGAVYGALAGRRGTVGHGLASGNGRLEATEIDVATKLPGRLEAVLVAEGELVQAGQPLARMQVDGLRAQRDEAVARLQEARHRAAGAEAQVALRVSDRVAAEALVAQRETELDLAERRLVRSQAMADAGSLSAQQLDDDAARARSTRAVLAAAHAQVDAAGAAIVAARTQVTAARSAVVAAQATIARIDADLSDCVLRAPRDGRVQYRIAEPGEVIGAGGKVLNLVDLTDVYMTFFLPETVAGRVALGADVHVVLDVAPAFVIPAKVSFVASTAQFTPKTVETASERQKLMFRVKARIDRELLQDHLHQVKTGVPGVAWVKTDPAAAWPAALSVKEPP